MTEPSDCAVCIIGAGPVGATLAVALAAGGVPVAVIDRAALPPMTLGAFDGRAYAIAQSSRRLLEAAGVWDRLPLTPNPIRRIRVADGRPGQPPSALGLTFDADTLGLEPFGHMVEARSLRVALNARLPELPCLRVFAPATATIEREATGATIRIADGPTLRACLVVAAEGRDSALRRDAAIRVAQLDYHQIGMVGAFAHALPHDDTALEQFLPNGPFAQLPLASAENFGPAGLPHASAYVWADRTAIARRMLALDDAGFGRELARRLGTRLGAVQPIGRRWSYPLSAMQVARWTDTRLALVGDAAHGVHPIAGQGLNLGFRDVAALAALITGAWREGADPGAPALLARYQAQRRPDSVMMLTGMHALERLFGNDFAPLRLARRLGIAAVDRLPGLKRAFARQAMGA